MGLSLKPDHLRRYRDIAGLLLKYGRSDMVFNAGLRPRPDAPDPASRPDAASDSPTTSKQLGPTFVKVGQLLSTRADLLPPDALRALSRLQDDVEPFPFEDVERIVTEELGVRISKAFARFDADADRRRVARPGAPRRAARRPRGGGQGAASQHPRAGAQGHGDIGEVAELPREPHRDRPPHRPEAHGRGVAASRCCASSTTGSRRRTWSTIGAQPRRVPAHRRAAAGRRLLDGARAHDGLHQRAEDHGGRVRWCSPKSTARELAEELFRAYLHQVILDGLFHADPHPGNVLLTDDKPHRAARSRHGQPAVARSAGGAAAVPAGRRRRPDRATAADLALRDGRAARGVRRDRVPPARRRRARAQPRRADRRACRRAG